jgi:hypothetical protein
LNLLILTIQKTQKLKLCQHSDRLYDREGKILLKFAMFRRLLARLDNAGHTSAGHSAGQQCFFAVDLLQFFDLILFLTGLLNLF